MYAAIVKSSTVSLGTSALAYLLTTILARQYSETEFAQYLYIVTWSLFIGQFIDCGALQCLTHFAKVNRFSIEQCWLSITFLKTLVFLVVLVISFILRCYTKINIPTLSILLLIPNFYLGNIYEYYGENVSYATIGFIERLFNVAIIIILVGLKISLNHILIAFFVTSLTSLFFQLKRFQSDLRGRIEVAFIQIPKYLKSYFLLYLILITQLFYGNISRLIVEWKIGVIPFASLTLSFQLVNLVSIVQSQVDRYLRPLITDSICANNIPKIRWIVSRYLLLYLIPLCVLAWLIALFASDILKIVYGSKWEHAGNVLKFACPQIATVACLRFIDLMFTTLGENIKNLIINLASVVFLILLLMLNKGSDPSSFMRIISMSQLFHVIIAGSIIGIAMRRQFKRGTNALM